MKGIKENKANIVIYIAGILLILVFGPIILVDGFENWVSNIGFLLGVFNVFRHGFVLNNEYDDERYERGNTKMHLILS